MFLLGPEEVTGQLGGVQALLAIQIGRPVMEALGFLLMAMGCLRGYALVTAGAAGVMLAGGALATSRGGASGAAAALGLVTIGAALALHRQLPGEVRGLSQRVFFLPVLIGAAAILASLAVEGLWPHGSSWTAHAARIGMPILGYVTALALLERRSLTQAVEFLREQMVRGEGEERPGAWPVT